MSISREDADLSLAQLMLDFRESERKGAVVPEEDESDAPSTQRPGTFRALTMTGCDAFELRERFDAESCAGAVVWLVSVRRLWDSPEESWTLRYGMFLDALLKLASHPPNAISRLRSLAERHLRVDLHLLEMGSIPRSAGEVAIIGLEGTIEAFWEDGEERSV